MIKSDQFLLPYYPINQFPEKKRHKYRFIMSSADVKTSMSWTMGKNSNWKIVPVENVPASLTTDCLSFICGNCFFYDVKKVKTRPYVIGVEASPQVLSNKIQLEALFSDAIGTGTDDETNCDSRRFQSHPSRMQSLMKNQAFSKIVSLTQLAIDKHVTGYSVHKYSVMYSLSFGKPQGLHIDDVRTPEAIENEGEMLSAIFALQDNTRLDIANGAGERQTYAIPRGSMFLFSGTCIHGGTMFATNNARIHMSFVKMDMLKKTSKDNLFPILYHCPIKDCFRNAEETKKAMTRDQLQDHWKNVHRKKIGVSLWKYEKRCIGQTFLHCDVCRNVFTSKRGLAQHMKKRCVNKGNK